MARLSRRYLVACIRVSTIVWLVAHYALTVAYVMPVNPVKIELQPVLNATIGAYFYQNWSFFAPNPLSSNYALLMRPLTQLDLDMIPKAGPPADGWYDLSSPVWSRFQENRLTAYDRVTRPQSNAIRQYLSGGPQLTPWAESCEKGDLASCAFYENQLTVARADAGRLLAKVGSAFCRDVACSSKKVTHVAFRARETMSVPWSQRNTAQPAVRDIELGIYPVNERAASTGLYLAPEAE